MLIEPVNVYFVCLCMYVLATADLSCVVCGLLRSVQEIACSERVVYK